MYIRMHTLHNVLYEHSYLTVLCFAWMRAQLAYTCPTLCQRV